MKKVIKLLRVTVLFAVVIFCLLGCAKADPKALAKETYDIAKETMNVLLNPSKAAELQKKAAVIAVKVNNLSAADKTIYNVELARLAGDDLSGLLDIGGNILNTSQGVLDLSVQANDALQNVIEALNEVDTNSIQQTIDSAAKQVNDLLDVFRKLSP